MQWLPDGSKALLEGAGQESEPERQHWSWGLRGKPPAHVVVGTRGTEETRRWPGGMGWRAQGFSLHQR